MKKQIRAERDKAWKNDKFLDTPEGYRDTASSFKVEVPSNKLSDVSQHKTVKLLQDSA